MLRPSGKQNGYLPHLEPLRAPRLQEETNTLEAKTPRQGKENRTVHIPSDDFTVVSSIEEEELEVVPAKLFYLLLSHKVLVFHCL